MSQGTHISHRTAVLIVGGGLGGVAAALAATDSGTNVILTEETDWLGGQISSQGVPPDEHRWIEETGRTNSYAELRKRIRVHYQQTFPLSPKALRDKTLNPGMGFVSKLCHLPRVGARVIEEMLLPAVSSEKLRIINHASPLSASVEKGQIKGVEFKDLRTGDSFWIEADYVLDATDLGDLLPLAGIPYRSGAESRSETGEPHAVPGSGEPDNVQALTWCFPLAYDSSVHELRDSYAIAKPERYNFWKEFIPRMTPPWSGPLLSLEYCFPPTCEPREFPLFADPGKPNEWNWWQYRRILSRDVFAKPDEWMDVSLINWPQNDYFLGNLIDASSVEIKRIHEEAKQLSLSLAYWLQNDVPKADGGHGYPGLHLRPDVTGTNDGLAKVPYIRESRRIKALFTVTESHIGNEARGGRWPDQFRDSVGVGFYRIDLHPSTNGRNYIDIPSFPYQIPLGALIPETKTNLIAAAKNIGTTHITNGCYRLQPTEWNIGEAAGALAAYCYHKKCTPHDTYHVDGRLHDYQDLLKSRGVILDWPQKCRDEFLSNI